MLVITLPDIYLEAPLHKLYFVRNPNYLSLHFHDDDEYQYGQNYTLMLQYCEEIDKNPALLDMSEIWMFSTEEKADGTWGLANDHWEHYRETGEILPYDGPGPNIEKHMDILLFGKKINDEYGVPTCSESVPLDDGEEVEFRYGLTYRLEKFIDGERIYTSYDDDSDYIKHLTEPPSKTWARKLNKN